MIKVVTGELRDEDRILVCIPRHIYVNEIVQWEMGT